VAKVTDEITILIVQGVY